MAQLNIPPEEVFGGLQSVGGKDDIATPNATDSRNGNIEEPGEFSTRPGIAKDNSTAKANPPIMDLSYIDVADAVTNIYIDSAGNAVSL